MMSKFLALLMLACSGYLLWYVFVERDTVQLTTTAPSDHASYEPRDWQEERESSLNISLYTFRDANRNGIYDVGDLPMSWVIVDLTTPSGDLHTELSNINGYANFKMARDSNVHPVSEVGAPYRFSVRPPPAFEITSGNADQQVTFRRLEGSVAGLVAEKPPHWVGLAPRLSMGFSLPAGDGVAAAHTLRFTLQSPEGYLQELALEPGERLEIDGHPGNWLLQGVDDNGGVQYERRLLVRDAPVEVLLPQHISTMPDARPHRVVEGFDWLQRSIIDKIPNGHLGLNWDYLLAVHNQQYKGPGYVNGLVSGHAVAYNSSGHPVTISAPDGGSFDFEGGYFSVAWPAAEGEVLEITAWRNGEVVAETDLPLSHLGPVWLDADLRSIDRLQLITRHYWQFVVDDLVVRLDAPPGE